MRSPNLVENSRDIASQLLKISSTPTAVRPSWASCRPSSRKRDRLLVTAQSPLRANLMRQAWCTSAHVAILPMLDQIRTLVWTRAALRGIGPAVIGVLAVSLLRLAPHALPDVLAAAALVATAILMLIWRVGAFKVMLPGAGLGIARSRSRRFPERRPCSPRSRVA